MVIWTFRLTNYWYRFRPLSCVWSPLSTTNFVQTWYACSAEQSMPSLKWTACLIPLHWLFGKFSLDFLAHDKGHAFIEMKSFFYWKSPFFTMDYFWEKFMRITYNSAYDILGTVQPDNENLIRIWIIWIQKVSILEIAPFFAF